MITLEQMEARALGLTDLERAELAERLIESLATPRNLSTQAAWLNLAKKRRDEIRSGSVAGIPGEEGSAMVRN